MPLSSRSQIVGAGANLVPPVSVGTLPQVVDVGPPGALSDSLARERTDGAVKYIVIGATNVREGVFATEEFRLSSGFISEGAGDDSFRAGRGAVVDANDAIVIGRGASITDVSNVRSVVIGALATALGGAGAVAIGDAASSRGAAAVVIGDGASINIGADGGHVVIGGAANVQANGGGPNLMAIGNNASAGTTGANGSGIRAVAIGNSAQARGKNTLVIGSNCSSTPVSPIDANNVVIGISTNVTGGRANTLIGVGANIATGDFNVVIGEQARGAGQNVILGSGPETPPANQARIGNTQTNITQLLLGQGDANAAPSARSIRFTNGSGTNIRPGNITWQMPRATGNATPVDQVWQGTEPGASGGTLQSLVTWMTWQYGGTANFFDMVFGRATTRLVPPSGGVIQVGNGTNVGGFVLDFGSLGAGIASLRFNGLTNGAGASAGTLTNAPAVGDPAFWIPVGIGGITRYIPAW